jgi:hypothetical protein
MCEHRTTWNFLRVEKVTTKKYVKNPRLASYFELFCISDVHSPGEE